MALLHRLSHRPVPPQSAKLLRLGGCSRLGGAVDHRGPIDLRRLSEDACARGEGHQQAAVGPPDGARGLRVDRAVEDKYGAGAGGAGVGRQDGHLHRVAGGGATAAVEHHGGAMAGGVGDAVQYGVGAGGVAV